MTEKTEKKAYLETDINSQLFSVKEYKLKDQVKSLQRFFTKEYIKDGYSMLDIGGAAGDLAGAIKSEIANIQATIIDPNHECIMEGGEKYPDFEFIEGFFPDDFKLNKKFDIVSMQALFPQIPNWKEMLLLFSKYSKKYINFECLLRMQGTTVVDKDVSYAYYLDSGSRVYQVIHNIYEMINFLCIEEMRVKKISFYGYSIPQGHNFRCLPVSEQMRGNFMIELFSEDDNPKRMGGAIEKGQNNKNYSFFIPEMDILFNDEKIILR